MSETTKPATKKATATTKAKPVTKRAPAKRAGISPEAWDKADDAKRKQILVQLRDTDHLSWKAIRLQIGLGPSAITSAYDKYVGDHGQSRPLGNVGRPAAGTAKPAKAPATKVAASRKAPAKKTAATRKPAARKVTESQAETA